MTLSAVVKINGDGKLAYKAHISDFDTPIGEATELQYEAYKRAHKTFEEAVAQINDHLAKEGIDKKLAALISGHRQVDECGNITFL